MFNDADLDVNIIKIENSYLHDLSTGGVVERSFWQNVSKIISKQTFLERGECYKTILTNVEDIITGKKRW